MGPSPQAACSSLTCQCSVQRQPESQGRRQWHSSAAAGLILAQVLKIALFLLLGYFSVLLQPIVDPPCGDNAYESLLTMRRMLPYLLHVHQPRGGPKSPLQERMHHPESIHHHLIPLILSTRKDSHINPRNLLTLSDIRSSGFRAVSVSVPYYDHRLSNLATGKIRGHI